MNLLKKFFGKALGKYDAGVDVEYPAEQLLDGKAIAIQRTALGRTYHVQDGDIFRCQVKDENGLFPDVEIDRRIKERMKIDTITTFYIQDALGYKNAICAAFGEASDDS